MTWISKFRTGIEVTSGIRIPAIEKKGTFILMLIKYVFWVAINDSDLNNLNIPQKIWEEERLYARAGSSSVPTKKR